VQPASDEPIVRDQPVSAELPPPNSQSMVPNLNITTTEVDLILNELAGRNSPPPGLPAPSIVIRSAKIRRNRIMNYDHVLR